MSGGTNTVQQTLPSWLQPYLSSELATAAPMSTASAQSLVAPFSGMQQAGQGLTGAVSPQAQSAANSALSANQLETSGALMNPASNPYLSAEYTAGANQVQNTLDSQFGAAGSNVINSTPVQASDLNNLAAQLYGGQYQSGLNAMTQATALSPGVVQGAYTPAQELQSTGATQQTQAQNLINAPYNALSWYSGLLGLNGSSLGGSTAQSNNNSTLQDVGLGIGALGSAAEIASILGPAMAASDRRLKRDIERIGSLPSGLPVYRFRYALDRVRSYLGVMADEVERFFPQAVTEYAGFKMVDYSQIG